MSKKIEMVHWQTSFTDRLQAEDGEGTHTSVEKDSDDLIKITQFQSILGTLNEIVLTRDEVIELAFYLSAEEQALKLKK